MLLKVQLMYVYRNNIMSDLSFGTQNKIVLINCFTRYSGTNTQGCRNLFQTFHFDSSTPDIEWLYMLNLKTTRCPLPTDHPLKSYSRSPLSLTATFAGSQHFTTTLSNTPWFFFTCKSFGITCIFYLKQAEMKDVTESETTKDKPLN